MTVISGISNEGVYKVPLSIVSHNKLNRCGGPDYSNKTDRSNIDVDNSKDNKEDPKDGLN